MPKHGTVHVEKLPSHLPPMIPRNRLPDSLHLRTQGGGFQHFHGFAHGEQFLFEVKRAAEINVAH